MTASQSPLRRALQFLGSVHFAMFLLIGGIAVMAVGTVIESREGLESARSAVYGTAWFDGYFMLLALNLIVAVVNRIPIKRHQWAFVLTHFAIVLLLAGAVVSRTFGFEGRAIIDERGSTNFILLESSQLTVQNDSNPEETTQHYAVPSSLVPSGRSLEADSGPRIEVLEHVHDGLPRIELAPIEGGSPGVEVQLFAANGRIETWLLANYRSFRSRDVGPVEVELLQLQSAEDLARRRSPFTASSSQVVIDPGDGLAQVVIEVPRQIGESVELGNGATARVQGLYASARVTESGLEEEPGGQPNPAVRVELARGTERELHTLFSLFPRFNLHTGDVTAALAADLRLEMATDVEKPLVSILRAPDGDLYVQSTTASGRAQALPAHLGESVALPAIGLSVQISKAFAAARPETVVEPCKPGTEGSSPALRVRLSQAGEAEEFWLPRGGYQRSVLAGETFTTSFSMARRSLPFAITLSRFDLEFHPGSNRPSAYTSHVTLHDLDGEAPDVATSISMNRPLDYLGYRLFQSSYQLGENGAPNTTVLSVSKDPGASIVYVAFILLILGVGWYLFGDGHRRRRPALAGAGHGIITPPPPAALSRRRTAESARETPGEEQPKRTPQHTRGALSLLLLAGLLLGSAPSAAAQGVPPEALEETGSWALQSKGRVKPLQTEARELVLAVTGRSSFDGLSALEIFWGYHLDAASFTAREYVRVDSKILKSALGYPEDQRRLSFDDLTRSPVFQGLVEAALELQAQEETLSTLQQDAVDTYEKLELVGAMISGALTVLPAATASESWRTPDSLRDSLRPAEQSVYGAFVRLSQAYVGGDGEGFRREASGLTGLLRAVSPDTYPGGGTLEVELLYNRLNAFGKAWGLYLSSFLLLILFGLSKRRAGYLLAMALMVGGLLLHTTGIGLRWNIAGRAPVSDMYESLVFMAWGVTVFGLILEAVYRKGYFGLTASFMGFLTLLFAERLPIDSAVNPLVPVLANTSWLSVHVMTIMLSYSAFALAMAMGHLVLVLQLFRPGRTEALQTSSTLLYRTLQVGLLFLAAGICFGAIWANRSWGRYWGWDPKETWSLITFFAYLALVHARFAGWLHHFGNAVWSILCFLSVVMTYYGVNFILGAGLHSYGFGSGGTPYVVAYLVIEFAIIGAATWRYRSTLGRPRGSVVLARPVRGSDLTGPAQG